MNRILLGRAALSLAFPHGCERGNVTGGGLQFFVLAKGVGSKRRFKVGHVPEFPVPSSLALLLNFSRVLASVRGALRFGFLGQALPDLAPVCGVGSHALPIDFFGGRSGLGGRLGTLLLTALAVLVVTAALVVCLLLAFKPANSAVLPLPGHVVFTAAEGGNTARPSDPVLDVYQKSRPHLTPSG